MGVEGKSESARDKILLRVERQHNLKDFDLEIPRDKLVVVTGLSGSGKSSLAFDTLYAEGQRRAPILPAKREDSPGSSGRR
jgi:excinuclease UvrABC ATPase subunit